MLRRELTGELLGDSENTCREWLSVDLSTAAQGESPDRE
jgi:hypothetical protein